MGICYLAIIGVSYSLFGNAGAKLILFVSLCLYLPFYLILHSVEIEDDERIFFALFLGIGLYPVLVYYMTKIVTSIATGAIVATIVLYTIGLYFQRKEIQQYFRGIEQEIK